MSVFTLSLALSLAVGAFAQSSNIDGVLKQLDKVQRFPGVSISPDGEWLIWLETAHEQQGNTEIYLLNMRTRTVRRRVTGGTGHESLRERGVAWAPDSKHIAFLSNAGTGNQDQIWVADIPSGKVRRLTSLNGYVTALHWSPDGKQVAFLYAQGGRGAGPLEAVPAQVGVIGADIRNQRLTLVSATGGSVREVSPANLNVYEYDWSAQGDRVAATAAPGPADNNWWIAKLYTLSLLSGEMKLVYTPPVERQISVPRWSPDGKTIGFIGGIMSDEGFLGGDIFAVSSAGGPARDLTPGTTASPNGFVWLANNTILLTESIDGGGAIAKLDVSDTKTEMIWKGTDALHQDGNFPNFSLASDGRTSAAVRSSWEKPPEVWAGPIGEWKPITDENAGESPHWGKAESLVWTNDGFRVQGWLVYPEHYDRSKRYPMVVEIHGGPAGMRGAGWPSAHFDMSVMAGLGYFVFFPNPRGSYGEGEDFTKANVKDFGGGDLRDILSGVDEVVKTLPVDERRIGVTGWSYGGYMTMWTVTQTNRFRAAVAGAGIANWQSYYGENSIDEWMIPYFGASVYDDPAVYAKSSPITFIKQVKTPTLVVVGERDGECPSPQSFEFWHALKTLGVPTELVVYAGEGHSFHDPADRSDVLRRTLAWFDEHLRTN